MLTGPSQWCARPPIDGLASSVDHRWARLRNETRYTGNASRLLARVPWWIGEQGVLVIFAERWADLVDLLPGGLSSTIDPDVSEACTLSDLGLSSMHVIDFMTALEDRFGFELTPQEFFAVAEASLGDLVGLVDRKAAAG